MSEDKQPFEREDYPFDSSTFSNVDGPGDTLSENDIINAINTLQGKPKFPDAEFDKPGSSWQLIFVETIIELLGVQIDEKDLSLLRGGNQLQMSVTFPVGEHSSKQNVAQFLEYPESVDTREYRKRIMKELLLKHFDEVKTWIDIAKKAKHQYSVEDILKIRNIEQRMAALRIFGPEKLIEEAQATLVSKSSRGNELYMIPESRGLFDEDAYFLKYSCVTTGRIYVSGVPNWLFNAHSTITGYAKQSVRDAERSDWRVSYSPLRPNIEQKYLRSYPVEEYADLAMAWKFRLTLEEYKKLSRTNEG